MLAQAERLSAETEPEVRPLLAVAAPAPPAVARVLSLQRSAGNAAVTGMLGVARACCDSCEEGKACEDDAEEHEHELEEDEDERERAERTQRALTRTVATRRQLARVCTAGSSYACTGGGACQQPDAAGAPDASGKWQMAIALDIEVAKTEDVGPATTGHAYVEFKGADGKVWTYGFYPDPKNKPDALHPEVNGCMVHPDTIHASCVDWREKYAVSEQQFKAALDFAQLLCGSAPRYHVLNWNCTTFAAEVAKKAGQAVPAFRGVVGGNVPGIPGAGVHADNPNTMMDSVKARENAPTAKLKGDSELREWLKGHSYDDIRKLPQFEKVRIISRLIDGWVSDDDLEAIEWVIKSIKDPQEMTAIVTEISPRVSELRFAKQRTRLQTALDTKP